MAKKQKKRWIVPAGQPLTALDTRILELQDKGILVPTRDLIKTPEQIEGIRQAGIINTAALDLAEREIKEGMTTAALDKMIHDFIISKGAIPACLGYEGFPKSCCISINEVVCHGIPSEDEEFFEGDIVNVDVTRSTMGIMPTPAERLSSVKHLLNVKNWYVWQKNVFR